MIKFEFSKHRVYEFIRKVYAILCVFIFLQFHVFFVIN